MPPSCNQSYQLVHFRDLRHWSFPNESEIAEDFRIVAGPQLKLKYHAPVSMSKQWDVYITFVDKPLELWTLYGACFISEFSKFCFVSEA